jgi:hypothetical protein
MILRKSMLRAVVVFTIVASERKVNFDSAPLALQPQRNPVSVDYLLASYF